MQRRARNAARKAGSSVRVSARASRPRPSRRAHKLLTAEEGDELVAFLAANPTAGDLVEGTGGVRKVRFAARGKGKSGGVRVIHYFLPEDGPLYALLIYGKGEQAEMSPEQRKAVM